MQALHQGEMRKIPLIPSVLTDAITYIMPQIYAKFTNLKHLNRYFLLKVEAIN